MMKRTTFREILQSFGRYFAILAIVALGVGFFTGLKITKQAMNYTVNIYYQESNLYDLHLLSTLGFTEEDVEELAKEEDVRYVEGTYILDAMYDGLGENEVVLKTHAIPEYVNDIDVVCGRLPESEDECVLDARLADADMIGKTIEFSSSNDEDTLDMVSVTSFTVVGLVDSSYYLNFERGTTSLGTGKVDGFIYIPAEAFHSDYYTDVFVCFHQDYSIYSDEYESYMDDKLELWDSICAQRVDVRYETILTEANQEIDDARQELEEKMESGAGELTDEYEAFYSAIEEAEAEIEKAEAELAEMDAPDYYVLDRSSNIGYVCFDNDSEIVNSIAKVFPIFFFLVAALVCMTTMNRMVEEQRTQIGILKALGYSEGTIMGKYMFYSGSAAVIGCIAGYFGGTYIFPKVIWSAYRMMYELPDIDYIINWKLAGIALLVSLLCSIGTTWLTCRYELRENAAGLMRPKTPKAGKRIFLEKIPWFWKRLKFLQKVSARNIFRYKKRFFLMIIGISGCTALLLTGFGIKDSIADFADQQYDLIQIYDASFTLNDEAAIQDKDLEEKLQEYTETYTYASESTWDLIGEKQEKSIYMLIFSEPDCIQDYMCLQTLSGEAIAYPKAGEAVISNKIAKNLNISVGDTVSLRNSDMQEMEVTISGIFENHVYNYIIIAPETYAEQMGEEPEYRVVYTNFSEDTDPYLMSAELMKQDSVISVTLNQDTKNRMANIMMNLNYVIALIIICAAALAFIVLYNLTNINITERIREIATIKVLGFFKKETASYVFRENIILTGLGILLGLLLGVFLHRFVINQINVDLVSFSITIRPVSYIYSIIMTFVFNFIIDHVMSVKLERINMAESLKSVD